MIFSVFPKNLVFWSIVLIYKCSGTHLELTKVIVLFIKTKFAPVLIWFRGKTTGKWEGTFCPQTAPWLCVNVEFS